MKFGVSIVAGLHLLLTTFSGCKGPDGQSLVKDTVESESGSPSRSNILFFKDDRNVDGSLIEITVSQVDRSKYDVSQRTAYTDRRAGKQIDETKPLIQGGSCAIAEALITCRKDLRATDGALLELSIDEQQSGKFKAILKSSTMNRRNGELQTETKVLGDNLKKRITGNDATTEAVDIVGDDGDKLFKALEALGVKDSDRMIGATNLRVTGLSCRTNSARSKPLIVNCTFTTINPDTRATETRSSGENVSSRTILTILDKYDFSTNGGINPSVKAVSANSIVCSLPTIPSPVASCVAER